MRRLQLSAPNGRVLAIVLLLITVTSPLVAGKKTKIFVQFPGNAAPSDKSGTQWSLDNYGRINSNMAGQVSFLQVNGQMANFTSRQMTSDQKTFVFKGKLGNIDVERTISFDGAEGGVRFVDTFTNSMKTEITLALQYHSYLHRYQNPTVIGESGTSISTALGKKDGGFVVSGQTGGRRGGTSGNLLFMVSAPRSKTKPQLQIQNQQLFVKFNLKLSPRQTRTLITAVANLNSPPGNDVKKLRKAFRPYRSTRWTRDIDRKIRRTIVNLSGASGVGFGSSTGIDLDIERQPYDQLAMGSDTLIPGTVRCSRVSIETDRGQVEIPLVQVSAIVGAQQPGGPAKLHLRDGQVLRGKLALEDLRFVMQNGVTIRLDADAIDRLVFRKSELDEVPQEAGTFIIGTTNGERILGRADPTLKIRVSTRMGAFHVRVDELRGILPTEEDGDPGFWIHLVNHTAIRGFLIGPRLKLKSHLFGEVEIQPQLISSLILHGTPQLNEEEELSRSHLVLRGGDRIIGTIDLTTITFNVNGGEFPIPPLQLAHVVSITDTLESDDEPLMFEATIWGGGEIQGEIQEVLLPVKAESIGDLHIPLRLIQEFRVPVPSLPEAVRKRIVVLVGQLGDADWQTRESAQRDLIDFGALAREPLNETLRRVQDPEVERRIQQILSEMGN